VDHYTIAAAVAAAATAARGLAAVWVQRYRVRQDARADQIRHLPPGSRFWDLNEGVLIEIGDNIDRGESADRV
jgi:hypothetical protein